MFKVYISSTETFDEIIESACESHVLCIDLNGQIFKCFNRNIKQFELRVENFKKPFDSWFSSVDIAFSFD